MVELDPGQEVRQEKDSRLSTCKGPVVGESSEKLEEPGWATAEHGLGKGERL